MFKVGTGNLFSNVLAYDDDDDDDEARLANLGCLRPLHFSGRPLQGETKLIIKYYYLSEEGQLILRQAASRRGHNHGSLQGYEQGIYTNNL
jgi:hypothetical protein